MVSIFSIETKLTSDAACMATLDNTNEMLCRYKIVWKQI